MTNRTILVAGTAAVALLAAVAMVVIGRTDAGGPARAPGASVPADAAAAAREAEAVVVPAAFPTPAPPVPAAQPAKPLPEITPAIPGARASAAAHVDWDRVPLAVRAGQLGPEVSGAVVAALKQARAEMESCFADEARLLATGSGPTVPVSEGGPAALTLRLASQEARVDIEEIQVVRLGTSSPQLVSCVRHVLTGWPIPAPKAKAGRRYQLRYTVQ
jgi:hypothetical protein